MLAIYLILFSVVLYSFGANVRKKISAVDDSLNYIYAVLFQLAGGLSVLIFSLLLGFGSEFELFFASLTPVILLKILVGAVLWFSATITSFKALHSISASKFSIIEALSPVVSIVLAMLLLGESFSLQQAAGMFLILLSVLSVVYDKHEKVTRFSKGELIGMLSVVLSGLALVNDKGIYFVTPLAPTLTALFVLPGILGAIVQPKELLKLPSVLKNAKIIRELAILSLIWGAAAIAYYKAIVLSNSISLVVSISQLSVIVTVIFGLLFLRERENWQLKLLAGAVSVGGLILMSV